MSESSSAARSTSGLRVAGPRSKHKERFNQDVEPMSLKKRRKPDEKARKEEVVLLKDLAPRKDVRGGAKLRFGEAPSSSTIKAKD